jgi:formylglycine-generating enzyme required for sulfatase activity
MEYANTRSIREDLKPYYIFSETNFNEPSILSKNNYIIAYFDFTKNEDKYVQISVDSSSNGYRLPYYDEWVMLARGGDKTKKAPWGDSTATFAEAQKYAKFFTETDLFEADPVGQLLPNDYGLYDMFGLVWEHVLFEKKNPFKALKGRPSCLKGGDDQVRENHIWYKAYRNPYWKWINYGYFYPNYSSGVEAGFRLIRKLK